MFFHSIYFANDIEQNVSISIALTFGVLKSLGNETYQSNDKSQS